MKNRNSTSLLQKIEENMRAHLVTWVLQLVIAASIIVPIGVSFSWQGLLIGLFLYAVVSMIIRTQIVLDFWHRPNSTGRSIFLWFFALQCSVVTIILGYAWFTTQLGLAKIPGIFIMVGAVGIWLLRIFRTKVSVLDKKIALKLLM